MNCNICHAPNANNYGCDPFDGGYDFWYCDKCAGLCITPDGKPIKKKEAGNK